jgi:hypothetical protein
VVGRRVLSRRRDAQTAEEAARALLRLCCADPSRIPSDVVDLHVELAGLRREYPDVDSEMLAAAQSLMWVLADRRRLAAMQRRIDVPVLLIHGDRDRLVNIASARAAAAANPSWQFEVARGVGHVPQLEVPQWTIDTILGWLAANPHAADLAAANDSAAKLAAEIAAEAGFHKALPIDGDAPTNHLDTFNSLTGAAQAAYFRANRGAILAEQQARTNQ